jgi:curved DNA-binding protein CbpA
MMMRNTRRRDMILLLFISGIFLCSESYLMVPKQQSMLSSRKVGMDHYAGTRASSSTILLNTSYQQEQESNSNTNNNGSSTTTPAQQSSNDISKDDSTSTTTKEKTLYEILRVNPLATRTEIKKQYFKLAKLSHPDAQINYQGDTRDDDEIPDFQAIAEAWKILGNSKLRKRYDRELRAKQWSESAQRFTNERLEQAVPVALDMMDKVAVPFLRRTTATTFAVTQAIASGVSGFSRITSKMNNNQNVAKNNNGSTAMNKNIAQINDNNNDVHHHHHQQQQQQPFGLTDTFLAAIEVGQQAGRAIDSLELNEKSVILEER